MRRLAFFFMTDDYKHGIRLIKQAINNENKLHNTVSDLDNESAMVCGLF